MGIRGGGRGGFCEMVEFSNWSQFVGGGFLLEQRPPPDYGRLQVLHLCAVDWWSGTILPWPGEKRQFEHFCKSDNRPASSLSLSNFVVFFIDCFIL